MTEPRRPGLMQNVARYWRDEIDRNWIIAGVLCVFFINAGMNGLMGWDTGDGGVKGVLYGGVFVSIAFCGAYAATVLDDSYGLRRGLLGALVVFQICLGQMAGWQTLGLTLDRGLAKHEGQATKRSVNKQDLARLRDERDALGTIAVPIASLRAKLALEARKTSRRYPDGKGPGYTKLADDLARAEKAAKLDADIKIAADRFEHGPKTRNANALFEVPAVLASWAATYAREKKTVVPPDDVRFGFLVFLVALLEFVATLGFWLFRVRKPKARENVLDHPVQLPPPPAHHVQITNDNGPSPGVDDLPTELMPVAAEMGSVPRAAGGASTNNIYVGSDRVAQALPPRVAARRMGA